MKILSPMELYAEMEKRGKQPEEEKEVQLTNDDEWDDHGEYDEWRDNVNMPE